MTEGSRLTSENKSPPEQNIQTYIVGVFNSSVIAYSPYVGTHTQTLCMCVYTHSLCIVMRIVTSIIR